MKIIYFLFLIATFKYWFYILLTPIVAILQNFAFQKKADAQVIPVTSTSQEMSNQRSMAKSCKSKIRLILVGMMRLHVFWTAYIPSHHIRRSVYKNVYKADIGKESVIYYGAELRGPHLLHIEEGSIIGDKVTLDARRGGIFIGKYVRINSNVAMWTGSHDLNDPYFRSTPEKRGPIHVGDRVWIGPNVTILHSVTIGEGAVVAAGAVVTKDVEPYTIVGGIPAKKIGERSHDLRYTSPKSYSPFL